MPRPFTDDENEVIAEYKRLPLEECISDYVKQILVRDVWLSCYLRSVIASRTIYPGYNAESPVCNDADKGKVDNTVCKLYKALTLEQCLELYRMQHDNLNKKTRFLLRTIIGAKIIYGANYGKPPIKQP